MIKSISVLFSLCLVSIPSWGHNCVQPELVRTLSQSREKDAITVLVKLDQKSFGFHKFPPSNNPQSPRHKAFKKDVLSFVQEVAADLKYPNAPRKMTYTAANLGIFKITATAEFVRSLCDINEIAGIQLTTSSL